MDADGMRPPLESLTEPIKPPWKSCARQRKQRKIAVTLKRIPGEKLQANAGPWLLPGLVAYRLLARAARNRHPVSTDPSEPRPQGSVNPRTLFQQSLRLCRTTGARIGGHIRDSGVGHHLVQFGDVFVSEFLYDYRGGLQFRGRLVDVFDLARRGRPRVTVDGSHQAPDLLIHRRRCVGERRTRAAELALAI